MDESSQYLPANETHEGGTYFCLFSSCTQLDYCRKGQNQMTANRVLVQSHGVFYSIYTKTSPGLLTCLFPKLQAYLATTVGSRKPIAILNFPAVRTLTLYPFFLRAWQSYSFGEPIFWDLSKSYPFQTLFFLPTFLFFILLICSSEYFIPLLRMSKFSLINWL